MEVNFLRQFGKRICPEDRFCHAINVLDIFPQNFYGVIEKSAILTTVKNSKGAGAQIAGLDKLIRNKKVPPLLKELVFPRMRPDKISMEAKNDILICHFGSRYLSTHREKHFVHVTSRKMRELAKLLIEVRSLPGLPSACMLPS